LLVEFELVVPFSKCLLDPFAEVFGVAELLGVVGHVFSSSAYHNLAQPTWVSSKQTRTDDEGVAGCHTRVSHCAVENAGAARDLLVGQRGCEARNITDTLNSSLFSACREEWVDSGRAMEG